MINSVKNKSLQKINNLCELILKNKMSTTPQSQIKQYDQTQLNLFNEKCILVDINDKPLGSETKKNCHLIENINNGMLHRAFSLFLFDKNDKLLLQQRSIHKITYPNHWTNTVCSHPLYDESEITSEQNYIGIKRAAKRRLTYELGIPSSQLDISKFNYLTRIKYKALNVPDDGIFGENEIDYVIFLRGDFELQPNHNEIKAVKYVSMYELRQLLDEEKSANSGVLLTPWFKFISETFLFKWWANLNDLKRFQDFKTIHNFS